MAAVAISIGGTAIPALQNMLNLQPVMDALYDAALMLRGEQAKYAGYFPHSQPFKSEASRRWFFWALKNGLIQVPYVRTQHLGASWEVGGGGLRRTVGTPASYAPLVKSERMTRYHRVTGWESAPMTTMRVESQILALVHQGIRVWLGI